MRTIWYKEYAGKTTRADLDERGYKLMILALTHGNIVNHSVHHYYDGAVVSYQVEYMGDSYFIEREKLLHVYQTCGNDEIREKIMSYILGSKNGD